MKGRRANAIAKHHQKGEKARSGKRDQVKQRAEDVISYAGAADAIHRQGPPGTWPEQLTEKNQSHKAGGLEGRLEKSRGGEA